MSARTGTARERQETELERRRKRLLFRAEHRGMLEADMVIGGFVRAHLDEWSEAEIGWFERLLEEPDRRILAWVFGNAPVPAEFDTPLMRAMRRLEHVAPSAR